MGRTEASARPCASRSGSLERRLARLIEEQVGVSVEAVELLAGDLGLRRFYRVRTAGEPATLIARVEAAEDPAGRPAGVAPEPALEPLRSFLEALGLPVPARFGGDPQAGIDLLEDLGDRSLADAVAGATPDERRALYRGVLGWLPVLQRASDPDGRIPAFGRRLDRAQLHYKAGLFAAESLPGALGRATTAEEEAAVHSAFERIAEVVDAAPRRLAHRDLQSHNVLIGDDGPAMIDFQGAFLAPPEYDLVCLLHDSYVELPSDEIDAHFEATRRALPDPPSPDEAARRFALLTLARKGKDHARFLYAARTRGDSRWLRYVPGTVRALQSAAARVADETAALRRLAHWIAQLPETPCVQ